MNDEPFSELGPEEVAELIEREGAALKIIDVRQPYEYRGGHLEGALLLPIEGMYSFARQLAEQKLPKDTPILFVCAVGQRSAAASEVAAIAGYQHVYNLAGGMGGWAYAGLPVVR